MLKRSTRSLLITAVFLDVAYGVLLSRQWIVDQVYVWQFQPSSQVANLAQQARMSDKGNFYYLASRPQIEESEAFNQVCDAHAEDKGTAILGCYAGQRIYVYNITDERLVGVTAVTAAHEMLHAVYDRMDASQKKHVDGLLEQEYQKRKHDPALAERMALYDRIEPGERYNELHSVLGTEHAGLSDELERYYAEYFAERQAVVGLHQRYEAVFDDLQQQAEVLSGRLTQLGEQIDRDSKQYNSDSERLDGEIKAFNAAAANGTFGSQSEFAAKRSDLTIQVAALNASRDVINNAVNEYNSLRTQLEAISTKTDSLNRSINSNLAPTTRLE